MARRRELVFGEDIYRRIRAHLLRPDGLEYMGIAFAGASEGPGHLRLIVRDFLPAGAEELAQQTGGYVEPTPDFVRKALGRARDEGTSLVEIHSHPFAIRDVTFSSVDTESELEKFPFVAARLPNVRHATAVMGQESIGARLWDPEHEVIMPFHAARIVGPTMRVQPTTSSRPLHDAKTRLVQQGMLPAEHPAAYWDRLDRQVMALGRAGQERLRASWVAVVGVSGIGSFVATELAHLGVGHLLLIDPDVVESVNLNRIMGAREEDAAESRPKVEVIRRYAAELRMGTDVTPVVSHVGARNVIPQISGVDMLIGCVDNDGARVALNSLATRYLIPYLDLASGVEADASGNIVEAGGQLRWVLPGGPCLECMDGIDRVQAGLDLEAEAGAQRPFGYVEGAEVPAPAVMPLNGAVASWGIWSAMRYLAGLEISHPYLVMDVLRGQSLPVSPERRSDCVCCGEGSPAGLGDLAEHGSGAVEPPSPAALSGRLDSPIPGAP